jgi:tetratricopeptide (TPR) repeat protein
MRIAFALVVTLAIGWGGVARAQDSDAEARQHYKAATGHFAVGEFSDAASEYESAYKLHQDPALLFNAAQSRRLAGENAKALVLYKNFLHLYPASSNIPAVREQIDKLEPIVAAEQKAKTAPPTNTVEPKNEPPAPTPTPEPQQQAQAQQQPPPASPSNEKPPFYKKWWFWTAIGAVVVLAVVIPVAIIETQPAWNNLAAQGPGAALHIVPSGASTAIASHSLVEVRW